MNGGVEILLISRTRVPIWIRNQTKNVCSGRTRVGPQLVRTIKIRRAGAIFQPGGTVAVKMPGSDEFWTAFLPERVLEIRNLQGKLLQRNYHYCERCVANTGKRQSSRQIAGSGFVDATFVCIQCGHTWEKERI